MCVRVCVGVFVWEREKEREKKMERKKERPRNFVVQPFDQFNYLCSLPGSQILECNFTIVQYRYWKCCSEDQMLQDLILCTSLCGTGFITQLVLLLIPVGWFVSARSIWSSRNVLHQLGTSFERAFCQGWPLNSNWLALKLKLNIIHRVGRN